MSERSQPAWRPAPETVESALITDFRKKAEHKSGQTFDDYQALWQWSAQNNVDFWSLAWDELGVIGDKGATILKDAEKMPGAQFFPDARINYAENCLRRRDDAPALIFRNEEGRETTYSFAELYKEVSCWQQAFQKAGLREGDRVAGYMPNIPETIIAMFAATSLGAIWSSASPDFGVQGVLDRFGQIEPKFLITVDAYFYNGKAHDCLAKVRAAQKELPSLETTIVVPFVSQAPELTGMDKTITAHEFTVQEEPEEISFARVPFNTPLFIMFSSGTTGAPKCIVHGHGGTVIQHLKEHKLHCDIKPDDRVFYFTTCGWMMWNWLVTALASEATLLLFDGAPFYPDGNVLWDFTAKHECKLFGTAAKYIDALKTAGLKPGKTHDLKDLKIITSTGSPLVHESFDYIYEAIKKDVHISSISGGTDIISCFVLGNPISPVYRGEIQAAGLGMAVDVLGTDGKKLPAGAGSGELVCTAPFPSMPVSFWNDPQGEKYKSAYFETFDNIWHHGDFIERTAHDGFIIHGRSDATLNPGGVRIGTAEIYRQVEQFDEIKESLVIGQQWEGDVRIVLFVVMNGDHVLDDDLRQRIVKKIRSDASPRHVPAKIVTVTDIPRTKSNKITELAVRDIVHGREVKNREALANPEALDLYADLPELKEA